MWFEEEKREREPKTRHSKNDLIAVVCQHADGRSEYDGKEGHYRARKKYERISRVGCGDEGLDTSDISRQHRGAE